MRERRKMIEMKGYNLTAMLEDSLVFMNHRLNLMFFRFLKSRSFEACFVLVVYPQIPPVMSGSHMAAWRLLTHAGSQVWKQAALFLFFTSPLVKSIPQRAVPLVTLVLIACRDMGQHNRFKHAQLFCLGKMEGGREAIAFRLSKLSATHSLASACRDEKKQSYTAL